MNGRTIFKVVLAVMVIVAAAGLAGLAFNAGVARGLAESGKLPAITAAPGAVPYPFYGPFFFHRPFGFGLLGLIFPLLFLFLLFGLLRRAFWHGPRWHGPLGGPWMHGWHAKPGESAEWEEHVPPMVAEWHRKMHEPQAEGTAER
ncbi:MAG: hypothetical protein HY784_02300 [Chloroflexi bacterium]|nr:hypothetical protein [Chloroflexota bacterium]